MESAAPALVPAAPPRRALALDALRGYAILTMVLSGMVPEALPAWMHHAQCPPPDGKFNPAIPGITWVDLVFPFFLFALGAAIPFALRRRMEKGMSNLQAVGTAFKRFGLLTVFAIFEAHSGVWAMKDPETARTCLMALAGFAAMFLVLVRLPEKWPMPWHLALRAAGWALGAALMFAFVSPKGEPFSYKHNNIILWLLANAALCGSLAWLVTRNSLVLRLGVLGGIMAFRLAGNDPGWVNSAKALFRIPGIFDLGPVNYLFIVIPGTIAGDMVLDWMRGQKPGARPRAAWTPGRLWAIAAFTASLVVGALVGLAPRGVPDPSLGVWARWTPQTAMVMLPAMALGGLLFRAPGNGAERLLKSLYGWGVYWFVVGLMFDPYEGGIKKDHATMSYYLVTAGLALFTLIAFTVVIDILGHRKWFMALLVDNGQNPMIAYVGFAHLIFPALALVGFWTALDRVTPGLALGTIRAFAQTLVLALVVSVFTRKKIFWRS